LAPLKRSLIRRGNPFFLEETVRTLVETKALVEERGRYRLTQPVEAIQIPATVQVMLAARIDRLAPEDKRLLQTASVIGKDVSFALLQAVGGLPDDELRAGLQRLQSAEFLYETELLPDLQISFKHALTHEVTYGGLFRRHRRDLHARIVEAIEMLYRDRLGEHLERLAHHAARGELREKTVDYQREAGRKAAARSALLDARSWFELALGALDALSETQSTLEKGFDIRLELRPVLSLLGEFRRMRERLGEAEVLAQRLDDDRRRGQVCTFMTGGHFLLGELDEAIVTAGRALEIAGRLGDLRLRIPATTLLAQAHLLRGDYERAVELASRNLAAMPADWTNEFLGNAAPPSLHCRWLVVMSLAQLGRFVEAAEIASEAIRLAVPTHHAYTVGYSYHATSMLHLFKGDWAQARPLLEQANSVWRDGTIAFMLPNAIACFAWVLAQLDEASESLSRLREGQHLLLDRLMANSNVGAHHALGRAALRLGRLDEARGLGDRAVEYTRRHFGSAAWAQHLLGDIATHPDRFDAESGEAHYRKALALAEPRGMRPLTAHCHFGLGKLYQRTGDGEQAREHFTTATTMYREMDMRFWLQQVETERQHLRGDTIIRTENRQRSTPRTVVCTEN
jgi:tetratricopeptide (TPR) repeat protein